MQQLLNRLKEIQGNRTQNRFATDINVPRHVLRNLCQGQGTLSSLHDFANAVEHVVTLRVEGYDFDGLTIADQLKRLRRASGITLKDAAIKAGVSETTAARIERDYDAYLPTLANYAAALDTELVLLSQDEIALRLARRDLDAWTDHAVLPLHALAGVDVPLDLINFALQRRVENLERSITR